jgi:peroxiredoxin Q/BCP
MKPMSHRTNSKRAARAERLRREQEARRTQPRQKLMRWSGIGAVGLIAVALVTVAIAGTGSRAGSGGVADNMSGSTTSGPAPGSIAPDFSLTNVVTGKPVTRASLAGQKTLLFFSEGVNCQPCVIQTADLQKSRAFARTGIRLVSVTTDPPNALAQAASQYGIHTPMLADPTTSMSAAYGMLGHGGMQHPTQDGHAFMLLDANGRVLWHQAYSEMYVDPNQLVSDMGPMA